MLKHTFVFLFTAETYSLFDLKQSLLIQPRTSLGLRVKCRDLLHGIYGEVRVCAEEEPVDRVDRAGVEQPDAQYFEPTRGSVFESHYHTTQFFFFVVFVKENTVSHIRKTVSAEICGFNF